MIIKRNKFTTYIEDELLRLFIPTAKFDDIMGIINGELPSSINDEEHTRLYKNKLDRDNWDFAFQINGLKYSMKDFLEYSDMSFDLFIRSIWNASTKWLKEKFLQEQSSNIINKMLEGICMCKPGAVTHTQPYSMLLLPRNSTDYSYMQCPRPRRNHVIDDALMKNSRKTEIYQRYLCDDSNLRNHMASLYSVYIHEISDKVFYDKEGNRYTFPSIGINVFLDVVKDVVFNHRYFKPQNSEDYRYMISIYEIIKKIDAWKMYSSGLLKLQGEKGEKLVNMSDLLYESHYKALQSGKMLSLKIRPLKKKAKIAVPEIENPYEAINLRGISLSDYLRSQADTYERARMNIQNWVTASYTAGTGGTTVGTGTRDQMTTVEYLDPSDLSL